MQSQMTERRTPRGADLHPAAASACTALAQAVTLPAQFLGNSSEVYNDPGLDIREFLDKEGNDAVVAHQNALKKERGQAKKAGREALARVEAWNSTS